MTQVQPWDRQMVHDELNRVRADFRRLLGQATPASLARRTNETRWTNEQLLFHMLFGYLIVRTLLPLVAVFGRLPEGFSRGYARLLNAATRPFNVINYLGPCAAIHIYGHQRMAAKLDRVLADLHRRIDAATPSDLARGMHYPARWDPFFTGYMTLADLFRYPTQHYDFHRHQLTLTAPA
jgi:DinB superfamily